MLKKHFFACAKSAFSTKYKYMVQYTCSYAKPVRYDGTTPVNNVEAWNYSSSTCVYNSQMYAPSTTIASSTDIALYGSFTAGEVIIAVMMFFLIVIELVKMLARSLGQVETKKTFVSYSGGDVEIRKDL